MSALSPLEVSILRDVLEGTRGRSMTPDNKLEHDAAIHSLIHRQLVRYEPSRPAQKFSLTWRGRAELDRAEKHAKAALEGSA